MMDETENAVKLKLIMIFYSLEIVDFLMEEQRLLNPIHLLHV